MDNGPFQKIENWVGGGLFLECCLAACVSVVSFRQRIFKFPASEALFSPGVSTTN